MAIRHIFYRNKAKFDGVSLMPKVTMVLTDRDVEYTARIKGAAEARSNAHAVSISLSVTNFIVEALEKGDELLLRNRDGEFEKVIIPDLPRSSNRRLMA